MKKSRIRPILLALLGAALLIIPFFAAAAPATKEIRKEIAARAGQMVTLENLAGKVLVEGKKDGPVEIVATIHAESEALLAELPIDVTQKGDAIEIIARYPVEKHGTFRYSGGEGSGSTSTTYLDHRVKVGSSALFGGVELWVDFILRVPAGTGASVRNEVGSIVATNVPGRLSARTGSGEVALVSITGDVTVQTGSGNAVVEDVKGTLDSHTGSGNVTARRVTGSRVTAKTGSGEIEGEEMTITGALDLDTGSGDIRVGGNFTGLSEARVGTGSGDVSLMMSKTAGKKLELSTGDGAANVKVRTSSGSIQITGS